jgi:hypothetical protein
MAVQQCHVLVLHRHWMVVGSRWLPTVSRAARRTSVEVTYTTTSTRDNFSTMTPIEEALAAIELREPGDDLIYQEYADWFGVSRSTLS